MRGAEDGEDAGSSGVQIHPPESLDLVATKFSIRKALEGRHLDILINLVMLKIEAEQKHHQSLHRFSEYLAGLVTKDRPDLVELKALTQEHLRLQHEFITKLREGRTLLVHGLESSRRFLRALRKLAAKRTRRQTRADLAKAKQEGNIN